MPSAQSWGIGEIPDLVSMARWLQMAGCDQLMLLPVGTMAEGEASPYSACSAMAIDPIYLSIASMEDFVAIGGVEQLPPEARDSIGVVSASERVQFAEVRRLKRLALWTAFERFLSDEWNNKTVRAGAFAGFATRERWWLNDYALFQACAAEWPDATWQEWPDPLARREAGAIAEARRRFGHRMMFEQYLQWAADEQWQQARQSAKALGVTLFGDLPFVVNAHSADVWARQDEFLPEVSVGVPPDSFSDTGQDWGLPMYRWDVVYRTGFAWLRQRARRMASLYDGFRVDHLVGFYRTYGKAPTGDKFFLPADEPTQLWQGEQAMRVFLESGVAVVAEDLGTVPIFVRESIARLGIGGYKVLRWERHWNLPGRPFVNPSEYSSRSVATTGTHDTEPMAVWWDEAAPEDRYALAEVLQRTAAAAVDPSSPWSEGLRDAILKLMAGASSEHLFFPIQDVFGWRERINIPATVGDHNWTWRLPWRVDEWTRRDETAERAAFLMDVRRPGL